MRWRSLGPCHSQRVAAAIRARNAGVAAAVAAQHQLAAVVHVVFQLQAAVRANARLAEKARQQLAHNQAGQAGAVAAIGAFKLKARRRRHAQPKQAHRGSGDFFHPAEFSKCRQAGRVRDAQMRPLGLQARIHQRTGVRVGFSHGLARAVKARLVVSRPVRRRRARSVLRNLRQRLREQLLRQQRAGRLQPAGLVHAAHHIAQQRNAFWR